MAFIQARALPGLLSQNAASKQLILKRNFIRRQTPTLTRAKLPAGPYSSDTAFGKLLREFVVGSSPTRKLARSGAAGLTVIQLAGSPTLTSGRSDRTSDLLISSGDSGVSWKEG